MIRRTLLFAVTLILVALLAGLMMRGCRQEKERTAGMTEQTLESPPSPIRVFTPDDLEIVRSDFRAQTLPGGETGAGHQVEIRHRGPLPYQAIRLRFAYLDRQGRILETRTLTHRETISPGATLRIDGIEVAPVPAAAAAAETSILSADLALSPATTAGQAP
jgi:hypothetical protein